MSPRPAQWKQVEVSGAQSHSLGPKSRVLSRMTTTSPCFYEPIAFRRLLIFHKFLSFATLPFSFQTFEGGNLKKWRGFNCWFSAHSLLPSSDGFAIAAKPRPALSVDWIVGYNFCRRRKTSLRSTQLAEAAFHPSPTSKSDIGYFEKSAIWSNERAQKARTTRM